MKKTYIAAVCACVSVVFIAILILTCLSLSGVEYYQVGFLRRRSSGAIFTDKAYRAGLYAKGPDFDFRTYPLTAHTLVLWRIDCTTKDTLAVELSLSISFFIRPDQLAQLHRHYQLSYEAVIRSAAMEVTKATSVRFTTQEFITNRVEVERAIQKAVRRRLGGNCCDVNCVTFECEENCQQVEACTDMGFMVDARYVHLLKVQLPYRVYARYLRALVLTEETLMSQYHLERAVVVKDIAQETSHIYNLAREVAYNSTSQAGLIARVAEAKASSVLGAARSKGLKQLSATTGLASSNLRLSADYLSVLSSSEKLHLGVDFNNFVIGSSP